MTKEQMNTLKAAHNEYVAAFKKVKDTMKALGFTLNDDFMIDIVNGTIMATEGVKLILTTL